MKIVSTATMLLLTLLAVPVCAYFFGTAPSTSEWAILYRLLTVTGLTIIITFMLGEFTGNNSQVDKLWSILPIIYLWIIFWYGGKSPRLLLMAILVTIWGIRLTANFALKGAYSWKFWGGEEDYRWKILRQKPEFQPRWKWTTFHLLFICGYQNILILLFCLPALVAVQYNLPLSWPDYMIAGGCMIFLTWETVADIQQWRFQTAKWALIRAGQPLTPQYQKGFTDQGLWKFSRHPNYFGEQGFWVCLYLFSIASGAPWMNWSITGCLLLIVLFRGSSNFSEEISASKYPEYKQYQATVSRFLPLPAARRNMEE